MHGVLDVEQPHHADGERDLARGLADLLEHLLAERVRGQYAGAVAGMHARLLDVLHDPPDPHGLAVAQRVDVDLDRVLEEMVEEDRPPVRAGLGAIQVAGEVLGRVNDLHRAAAEHVARAHQQREADLIGLLQGLRHRVRGRIRRRLVTEALKQGPEATAVLGEVDCVDARAQQRHARCNQAGGELQRGLPAELHDLGGLDAAVVELDALPDPVRPGAEDHDRFALSPLYLIARRAIPAGVEVGRACRELRRAGVHRPERTLALERLARIGRKDL